MEHEQSEPQEAEQGEGGFSLELVKSYLAFAGRALRARIGLAIVIGLVGLSLTVAVHQLFPRTYRCTTILMGVSNPVLDGDRDRSAFSGAQGLIMRRENLEAIVRETGLVAKMSERRPPLLELKDTVRDWLLGPVPEKFKIEGLISTLENRIGAFTDQDDNLNINADWNDAVTAKELAEAAKDSFLRTRQSIEISAFEDKMSILDAHATKLRAEIDTLAQQLRAAADAKTAQVSKSVSVTQVTPTEVTVTPLPRAGKAPAIDAELPVLRDKLAALKGKLEAAENDRKSRMRDEQAKLAELKLKLTPNHPQVATQAERVAMASQVSSELALMRADAADLDGQIKQRQALGRTTVGGGVVGGGTARAGAGAAPTAEPLPAEIMSLLGKQDDSDPALTAQLSGAIVRYGAVRDDVRAGKISLDTAQAAFNHRYKMVVPPDVPNAPIKPKAVVVFGAGIVLSLLLALLIPIALQLKNGMLVEYWQVQQFQLPVLAQLRLPGPR